MHSGGLHCHHSHRREAMKRWIAGLAVLALLAGVASGDIISWHASSGVLPTHPSIPADQRFAFGGQASFVTMQSGFLRVNDNVVSQAVTMAGGLTEFAKKNKLRVIRKHNQYTEIIKIDYSQIEAGESVREDISLRPGDTLIVP